ncbi:uridine kinase [Streptomyces sp. LHD-70]|uniref:uridine kinase n=1 Tax=Streptomyces sp. LHD-70 TaxID=3072140 RepID=UPI00280E321D|nr:uridine kinase [Streptomyces sp. LHD-70]MDQ8701656.1 uridine kinase [Streptomyces sp. LHD-70]
MARVRLEPITWDRLTDTLADRIAALAPADGGAWPRIGIDGAPAAGTGDLARRLAEALRVRGRSSQVVDTEDFLRPASLRFEYGHRDPESYYDGWFDTGALWREVLGPLDPGGTGRILPDLWDAAADRATRSPYVRLPPGGVLLLHGPLLLGQWFPFDLTVHLALTPGSLRRRTPPDQDWTLPAFARYAEEVAPQAATDVLVRADDPQRPAWGAGGA